MKLPLALWQKDRESSSLPADSNICATWMLQQNSVIEDLDSVNCLAFMQLRKAYSQSLSPRWMQEVSRQSQALGPMKSCDLRSEGQKTSLRMMGYSVLTLIFFGLFSNFPMSDSSTGFQFWGLQPIKPSSFFFFPYFGAAGLFFSCLNQINSYIFGNCSPMTICLFSTSKQPSFSFSMRFLAGSYPSSLSKSFLISYISFMSIPILRQTFLAASSLNSAYLESYRSSIFFFDYLFLSTTLSFLLVLPFMQALTVSLNLFFLGAVSSKASFNLIQFTNFLMLAKYSPLISLQNSIASLMKKTCISKKVSPTSPSINLILGKWM